MRLFALVILLLSGCTRGKETQVAAPAPAPLFRDASEETGLKFQHFLGATGQYHMPEIVGSGVALVDYDNDGDLDVYFVQGTMIDPGRPVTASIFPPPQEHFPGNRLFRNELIPSGKLQFTDVTDKAGVGHVGYGMGVAVGDYNGDGYPDLYVTNFGSNVLYRNNGDGTFIDVTKAAGVAGGSWGASAAWVDYDRDGNLDLVVAQYVDYSLERNRVCSSLLGERDYCGPGVYRPMPAILYHNEGNGRFRDVTRVSGIGSATGNGLGVSCADFNGDGWPDIYVANDMTANHLWINQHNGTFRETGLESGTAYNGSGAVEAGMGIATADFDDDGDEDILVTNFSRQQNTLYRNQGRGTFEDVSEALGLAAPSLPYTGFGTEWFDYDNDGLLDLFVANGTVEKIDSLRGHPHPYGQNDQLFHNEGSGRRFRETTAEGGPALALKEAGRGAAFGDIDNDGDIDIVVTNNNGPARLLINQTGNRQAWLGMKLEASGRNRVGVGARIGLLRKGLPTMWRRVHSDGSYLSASDTRAHFGLGRNAAIDSVTVQWPDGREEAFRNIRADTFVTLKEASGTTITAPR